MTPTTFHDPDAGAFTKQCNRCHRPIDNVGRCTHCNNFEFTAHYLGWCDIQEHREREGRR